jgi:hypothetical protein
MDTAAFAGEGRESPVLSALEPIAGGEPLRRVCGGAVPAALCGETGAPELGAGIVLSGAADRVFRKNRFGEGIAWRANGALRAIVRRDTDFGASSNAGPLPNLDFTPGATTTVAMSEICSMNHDEAVRPLPSTMQQTVFQEYGMRQPAAANYEIDFLISPGLGGAEDLRNLWPEPCYNTLWNSFVKDQLEDYLHQSVCGGRISLAAAKQDIDR